MKKNLAFVALIILILIVMGCSASAKRYEESIEAALDQIEAGELEKAKVSLEAALVEKSEDEKANAYYNQIEAILKGEKALESGDLVKAEKHAKEVVNIEGGLIALVNYAEDFLSEVETVEKAHASFLADIAEAEKLFAENEFAAALELLDQLAKEENPNAIFTAELDRVASLQTEVKVAETAEQEQREKEEQERLAKEKAEKEEQERLAKEKQQGVGLFEGYWLKDTMACHITDTYTACALAESDFMTNDKIISSKLISDSEFEITYEGNSKVTLQLRDQNSLELADGIYKRVSTEEANAIYGGYYTLP